MPCKLPVMESGHKQHSWSFCWKWKNPRRNGNWSQVVFLPDRWVQFTLSYICCYQGNLCRHNNSTMRGEKKHCEGLSLKKTKTQLVHYAFYRANGYVCSSASLWSRTFCMLSPPFNGVNTIYCKNREKIPFTIFREEWKLLCVIHEAAVDFNRSYLEILCSCVGFWFGLSWLE